ncbi:quinol monooxygenase YgiN [Cricetibacter osteomyelitidis]|uniref:Quinol monooxygenase YgiN n=1 Tax=Cricetibacter osteomyelitidis TaxID=1521931 RepID=A0A4R2T588_9PAST|nr:putative quinol monooxygenase [Cricetibacter osteomyelitidis]TCP90092.1 quinol monooxygenase YgiN [Cricetibacter osteomyelitidis]
MIAVYALANVKADKTAEFEQLIQPLITASRHDQGCISYVCGKVQGRENQYAFIEQWQTATDLELHMQQPHFTQAAQQFEALLSQPLNISLIELD